MVKAIVGANWGDEGKGKTHRRARQQECRYRGSFSGRQQCRAIPSSTATGNLPCTSCPVRRVFIRSHHQTSSATAWHSVWRISSRNSTVLGGPRSTGSRRFWFPTGPRSSCRTIVALDAMEEARLAGEDLWLHEVRNRPVLFRQVLRRSASRSVSSMVMKPVSCGNISRMCSAMKNVLYRKISYHQPALKGGGRCMRN